MINALAALIALAIGLIFIFVSGACFEEKKYSTTGFGLTIGLLLVLVAWSIR